jgi:hypothetical protein
MSVATAPSIVIKVPVHAGKPRAAPPVAARLKARSFPARHGASPEVRPETLTESWHPRASRLPSFLFPPSPLASARVDSLATAPSTRVSLPPETRGRERSRLRVPVPGSLTMPLTTTHVSPQAVARKELIVAARKARVSANAAAHNARVSDVHDVTALVESQVKQYRRSSIDRRLEVRNRRHLSLFLRRVVDFLFQVDER